MIYFTADMPWPQIACVEHCVEGLFFAVDGGAYAHCDDPVAAAMFLAPQLFKSCLAGGSACHVARRRLFSFFFFRDGPSP